MIFQIFGMVGMVGLGLAQQFLKPTSALLLSPSFQIHRWYMITRDIIRGVFPEPERIRKDFPDVAVVTDDPRQRTV